MKSTRILDGVLAAMILGAIAVTASGQSDSSNAPLEPHGLAPSFPDSVAIEKRRPTSGSTPASEKAVDLGLQWLAKQQNADGSWSFQGNFANPGKWRSKTGATGLVLLPFLGAGQTHTEGKHKATVRNGLNFLIKQMKITPKGGDLRGEGGEMLWHAMATIALCEAYDMSRDKILQKPAQYAIDFSCAMQDPASGGWAANSGEKPSTAVTAWQVMAMKSAYMAYLRVPRANIKKAPTYFDTVQVDKGARYGKTSPKTADNTATAAGLLSRMYLGWKWDNEALNRGIDYLSETGPSEKDVVYNYFGQKVMRHRGEEPWTRWNRSLRDRLVEAQLPQGESIYAGSWFCPDDPNAAGGGRIFQTAINVMTLEVYYTTFPVPRRHDYDQDFPE